MKKKQVWIYTSIALAILLSFLFRDSFRQVISRKKAIHDTKVQLAKVEEETSNMRARIYPLQTSPEAFEKLVRKELGYLKPGEKEVRFINK